MIRIKEDINSDNFHFLMSAATAARKNEKECIKVIGHILLADSGVNYELPNNLIVTGDVDIRGTTITKLPKKLTVYKGLFIQNSRIKSLRKDLKVREGIYVTLGKEKRYEKKYPRFEIW